MYRGEVMEILQFPFQCNQKLKAAKLIQRTIKTYWLLACFRNILKQSDLFILQDDCKEQIVILADKIQLPNREKEYKQDKTTTLSG